MRRAFTLLELMVTIAVMAFLLFLMLLPSTTNCGRAEVSRSPPVYGQPYDVSADNTESSSFDPPVPARRLGPREAPPLVEQTALYDAYDFEVGDKGTAGEAANATSIRNWGGSGDVAASGNGPFYAESFIGPSSNHRAGAYFALMDGSVKFVRNSVALAPYVSLGTINGGEPIDLDAF